MSGLSLNRSVVSLMSWSRVGKSQMRMVPSHDAETIKIPLGLKVAELTKDVCPFNGSPTCFPVFASHILTVLSHDAETIEFPSGLKEAE